MHHKSDILQTDAWEGALGEGSTAKYSEITALSPTKPDSDIRRQIRRRSVRKPNKLAPPALTGRILESIVLHPGGHREARFHPNTAQLDFVVAGDARIGILGQTDDVEVHYASEGEVAVIPKGCGHWIENMSESSPLLVLVLASQEA